MGLAAKVFPQRLAISCDLSSPVDARLPSALIMPTFVNCLLKGDQSRACLWRAGVLPPLGLPFFVPSFASRFSSSIDLSAMLLEMFSSPELSVIVIVPLLVLKARAGSGIHFVALLAPFASPSPMARASWRRHCIRTAGHCRSDSYKLFCTIFADARMRVLVTSIASKQAARRSLHAQPILQTSPQA